MRKNFYKILITLVIAILMVTTVVLTACNNASKFPYPSAPEQGEVSSNGGLAVKYGDYLYYVNGNQTTATSTNKYTGTVKTGDIVRIKIADLQEILAFNDDDSLSSTELKEKVQETIYEKAEVVVPQFYYSGNTTEKNVNGLYIYGDKLYFTSPNTALSAGGDIKNSELSVFRCDLDGKNLTNLFAMDSLTALNALYEVDGKVYLLYVSTGLNVVDLSVSKPTAKEISKTATSPKFDGTSSVAYINDDGDICKYTVGTDAEKVLVDNTNKDQVTYTLTQYNNGYVYYTKADTNNSSADFGVWAVKEGQDAKWIYKTTKDSAGSALTYLCYNEQVILTGATFSSSPVAYQLYLTSGNGDQKTYILPLNSNDKSITLNKVVGNILYYTADSKQYTVDLTNAGSYTPVELTATITANGWAELDIVQVGDRTLFFAFDSSTGILCYEYKTVDDEKKSVSTTITVIKPAEDSEEK